MSSELLTVQQYARVMQVSPQTVYRNIRAGRIPAVKVLGQWRIPRAAVPFGGGPR